MHAVVGVASYGRLERRLVGHAALLAEVHVEVCQVLYHHHIVACGEASEDFQLMFGQTHPRGVVRVAEQHCCDTPCLEMAFEFFSEGFSSEVRHIESLHAHSDDRALLFLHRETGVDEEHRVALFVELGDGQVERERRLHGAYRGHDTIGRDVQSDECPHELAAPVLHLGNTRDERIVRAATFFQRFVLCSDTHRLGGQSGLAQLHVDKLLARSTLNVLHYTHQLANTRIAQLTGVAQTKVDTCLVN